MPERVLAYCTKPPLSLEPCDLESALRDADLKTLAEFLDLPEGEDEAVDEMWRHFRIEGKTVNGAEIVWHATQRPIQIEVGPPLDGEIGETLDVLPKTTSEGVQRVRDHVSRTQMIVAFEMGIHGAHHLAATIAEVLAFHVAEQCDGIVWFYGREFVSPDDRGATLCTTE